MADETRHPLLLEVLLRVERLEKEVVPAVVAAGRDLSGRLGYDA